MKAEFNLDRFVQAQEPIYSHVLSEMRGGQKKTHWMWFVFPQLKGLGQSSMARQYGIASIEEARAYLQHSILGPRLNECTALVNAVSGRTIDQIFGYPDDLKFRSSMTLFAQATDEPNLFDEALRKYFGGAPDPLTIKRLASHFV